MGHDQAKFEAMLVELCGKVRSAEPATREEGWKTIGHPEMVTALADGMASADKPTAKAAKELLIALAHRAARPGAGMEAAGVTKELIKVANSKQSAAVRGYALHLLGCTADGRSVPKIALLLGQEDVQDEARMALERVPGSAATNALKTAMKTAAPDFRAALMQSLANRAQTPKTVGLAAITAK